MTILRNSDFRIICLTSQRGTPDTDDLINEFENKTTSRSRCSFSKQLVDFDAVQGPPFEITRTKKRRVKFNMKFTPFLVQGSKYARKKGKIYPIAILQRRLSNVFGRIFLQ